MKHKMLKGEMTVFLSLIFVLLLSLISHIIQSASVQVSKNYSRVMVTEAVESVFAEYQRALLEEYDIFAMDASYETGQYAESQIIDRLAFYGAQGMEHRIDKIQLLTDEQGQAFKEQVVNVMKLKDGLDALEKLSGNTKQWEEQKIGGEDYQKTDTKTAGELEDTLQENGGTLSEAENPLTHISQLKSSGFLQLVAPSNTTYSTKSLDLSLLPSHRTLHTGHGTFQVDSTVSSSLSNIIYGQYLKEHFGHMGEPGEGKVLDYEIEYLVEGKGSDQENLEGVAKKMLLLRLGPNYGFLLSSTSKQAEAETMALAMATAAGVPVAEGAVKQALLVAWAYGESVMDVRALLGNKKVPMVKSEESWQLDLDGLLKLGTAEDMGNGRDDAGGIGYEDYLTMLLFLENQNQITMRTLDLIEQNLRVTKGLTFFRVDACMSRLQVQSKASLQRGVTYTFPTYFSYR